MIRERGEIDLDPDDLEVITEMQRLEHGRIERAYVRRGRPYLSSRTKILKSVGLHKHPKLNPRKPWVHRKPHRKHKEFITGCRTTGHGIIDKIDVVDGLPFNWQIQATHP